MGFQIQFPDSIGAWLLWTTIHSSFLVAFVLVVQWALQHRLSARFRSALWWLVVLRLLMPVSVQSDLSLFNLWPQKAEWHRTLGGVTGSPVTESPPPTTKPFEAAPVTPAAEEPDPIPAVGRKPERTTRYASSQETHSQPTEGTGASWHPLVGPIWLFGAGVMAGLLTVCGLLQYRRLRFQPWIRDRQVMALLAECKREMGVRRHVDLVQAPATSTPALYGLFRPWLLLPSNLHRELSIDRLRYVFLHELAHLKRGDIAFNWIASLLLALHWFNPVVWLAVWRMRSDCELACDELALSFAGENENRSYGETVLEILNRATWEAPVPGLVGIVETNKPLKRRIRMIANFKKPKQWSYLTMATVGVLGILALTDASRSIASPDEDAGDETQPIEDRKLTEAREPGPTEDEGKDRKGDPGKRGPGVFQIVDLETEEPITGVQVEVELQGKDGREAREEYLTDETGHFKLARDLEGVVELTMTMDKPDYLTLHSDWSFEELQAFPESHTFKMSQGEEIGGVVRDEGGEPIPNVDVRWNLDLNYILSGQEARWAHRQGERLAVTDSEGRWVGRVWPGRGGANLRFSHPDFADAVYLTDRRKDSPRYYQALSPDELEEQAATAVLEKGAILRGNVKNANGSPVSAADVTVSYDDNTLGRVSKETDAKGEFRAKYIPYTDVYITVQKAGIGPVSRVIRIDRPTVDVNVVVSDPKRLRGRVVNQEGEPVPDAEVSVVDWGVWKGLEWSTQTGAEGRFVWESVPDDRIRLRAEKAGHVATTKIVQPDTENELTLSETLKLFGTVTDAETGESIDEFRMLWGGRQDIRQNFKGQRKYSVVGTGGEYELDVGNLEARTWADGYYHYFALRVESNGYRPEVSRLFKHREGAGGRIRYDFELEPQEPFEGRVVGPDGQPVVGAEVALISSSSRVWLDVTGRFKHTENSILTHTDDRGRFTLFRDSNLDEDETGKHAPAHASGNRFLTATHESKGFVKTTVLDFEEGNTLELKPWGRVEGVLRSEGSVLPREEIHLVTPPSESGQTVRTLQTDAQGEFIAEKVPAGKCSLYRMIDLQRGASSMPRKEFVVEPGETAEVVYGGDGRRVIGRLRFDNAWFEVDWSRDFHKIRSTDGERRSYPLVFSSDGSFEIKDVPPGEYRFDVRVTHPEERRIGAEPVARLSEEFEVPEPPQGEVVPPVNIGTYNVSPEGEPRESGEPTFGDAPSFELEDLDGNPVRLSNYEGQYLFLDFWATWCGPCIGELPHLRRTFEEFGDDDRFVMIGLSLDQERKDLTAFLEETQMGWTQVFLGPRSQTDVPSQYNVGGIPATFLIDPEGRIIAKDLHGNDIYHAIAQVLE